MKQTIKTETHLSTHITTTTLYKDKVVEYVYIYYDNSPSIGISVHRYVFRFVCILNFLDILREVPKLTRSLSDMYTEEYL